MRAAAILVALVIGLLGAGLTIAVIDALGTPTCSAIDAGDAELPSDGECADTGEVQNAASNLLLLGSCAGLLLAALALAGFGATGRARPWLRGATITVAAGVALFALAFAVSHV